MALDLRGDAGRAVLTRMIERADVLVENFRPGVLAEMGSRPTRCAYRTAPRSMR